MSDCNLHLLPSEPPTGRPDPAAGHGLLKLALSIVHLLHELMERQSLRRMEDGSLAMEEIERLGLALAAQSDELARLRKQFGFAEADLNLDLGPLGNLY